MRKACNLVPEGADPTSRRIPDNAGPVFFGVNIMMHKKKMDADGDYDNSKMSKGHEPKSTPGGMNAHLAASPGNNPSTSRECDDSFSSKNMPKSGGSGNKKVAPNQGGV